MYSTCNRVIAAATAAAIALTAVGFTPAAAAPASKQTIAASDSTDFSGARRRDYGNRAALGAVLGVFGAIATIAAANAARDRAYGYYDYGYGPYDYGYAPNYGGYAAAPAFRFGGGHHHHHHR